MNYEKKLIAFLLFLIIIGCLLTSKTEARNDYLGSSNSSCERGRIELYTELRGTDGKTMMSTEPLEYVLVGLYNRRVMMTP